MDVQRIDTRRRERGDDVAVQPRRKRLGPAGAALDASTVGDLGSVEKGVPGGGVAQDAASASARAAASSYRRRGCGPWIASPGSPLLKTITVGSESRTVRVSPGGYLALP